jgi:hypothetical protein
MSGYEGPSKPKEMDDGDEVESEARALMLERVKRDGVSVVAFFKHFFPGIPLHFHVAMVILYVVVNAFRPENSSTNWRESGFTRCSLRSCSLPNFDHPCNFTNYVV